jgi:hypothetical protein
MEPAMRRSALIAILAIGAIGGPAFVTPAEAQSRRQPLGVTVEGRSWLDAGKAASEGSYNRHLGAANRSGFSGPTFNTNSLYGAGSLPDVIGAGANPFANTIWTPGLR